MRNLMRFPDPQENTGGDEDDEQTHGHNPPPGDPIAPPV